MIYFNCKQKKERKGERKMFEMFDMVFEAVMEELDLDEWYQLFDSEDFGIVEQRIATALGISTADLYDIEEFDEWTSEMAMDL